MTKQSPKQGELHVAKREMLDSENSTSLDGLGGSKASDEAIATPKSFSPKTDAIELGASSTQQGPEMTMDEKRFAADQQAHLPHIDGVRLWILIAV